MRRNWQRRTPTAGAAASEPLANGRVGAWRAHRPIAAVRQKCSTCVSLVTPRLA